MSALPVANNTERPASAAAPGDAAGANGLESYLLSVAHGRRGLAPALLRFGLGTLAPLYCAGLKTYLMPYRLGIRRRSRLPCPVLSIGNLTTGGTGKTPLTQTLCRLLLAQGRRVVILSRGYGGAHERDCAIVSDGQTVRLTATEAGDEAALLAATLPGVPVVVGKDRRMTGRRAWETFHPDLIVLDDGMQFWQLHRDLDVVLLNACAPFDNGWTFPRGLLREPPSHLRRAGIVVLTNAHQAGAKQTEAGMSVVRHLAPGRPIFTADLAPTGMRDVTGSAVTPLSRLQGRRVAALSAIGNPASFETMLEEQGSAIAARFRFRDHQAISAADLERVFAAACAAQAELVVTTEKDAVKIASPEGPLPLLVLQVNMQIADEAAFLAKIQEML